MSSLIAAVGERAPVLAVPNACCRNCAFFNAEALLLEAQIPGLRSFGSGFAAVCDGDGLCAKHQRYLTASSICAQFSASA